MIGLLVLWGLLGIPVALHYLPQLPWTITGIAIAAIALLDMLLLWRRPTPLVRRELPDSLAPVSYTHLTLPTILLV